MTRQQLSGYSIDSSEWLLPAYELLKDKVPGDRITHLDETFIHCREEENSRQYMLVFASENGCFCHYTNSRSQTVPPEILQPVFEGGGQSVICTDCRRDPGRLADS